jgi:hypothetical protein
MNDTKRLQLIGEARALYEVGSDDNIEIDDNAQINAAEGGTWVAAWVWVPDEEETNHAPQG